MNNELIKNIVENYETPTYVFDIKTLKDRIKYLKDSLPEKLKLCYAIKANTFIVKDIENDVDRFEVCSNGEYEICHEKKVDDSKILISGINKDSNLINKIISESDIRLFSIETMSQYESLKKQKENVKILIRITSGNQFGINEDECKKIFEENKKYSHIEIVGLQYFTGTQKNSIKVLKKELDYMDNLIEEIENTYDIKIKELEFGTGLPVHYFENDSFDEDSFLKEFGDLFKNIKFKGDILLEIGRSISASCGMYLTKVVDLKTNKNENFAIVDGGINHLVYYGQFMAMKIPHMEIYPKRDDTNIKEWNICGSLCTINDILVKKLKVSNLEVGDVLIFKNTGAYCMTEGISLFLSRDLPQVLINDENNNIRVVRNITPTYKFNM